MYQKYIIILLISSICSFNGVVYASLTSTNTTASSINNTKEFDEIKPKLTQLLGKVNKIRKSPLPGVLEVITAQGIFYVSEDGRFLIHGKLYQLNGNIVNLTEQSLNQVRVDGMAKFAEDMIIYPAKNEKYVVTIFTDITCGYCRKLHKQMDDYNNKGITIRYLAYPRAGIQDGSGNFSKGFKDLRSIWCHQDPNMAMTKAKNGSGVAERICDKPIAEEFNFGRKIGVNGTPAIILSNGTMISGYQTPEQLLAVLSQTISIK